VRIALIVGGSALTLSIVIIAGWKLWKHRSIVDEWHGETFRRARYYEVLKTFCAEVAVLWLVFPVIDVLEHKADSRVLYLEPLWVAVFMILAGLYARKEEVAKKEEAKPQEESQ